jgi:hypothetical protein
MVGTESAVTESPYLAAFSSSRRCRWEAAADAFADRGLRKSRNWESAGEVAAKSWTPPRIPQEAGSR